MSNPAPIWKLTEAELPTIASIVLVASPEGYIRTAKIRENRKGQREWSTHLGMRPLSYFRAWTHIPRIDV